MMLGGLAVWVRVGSLEREQRAQRILSEHGGEFIRVHELEIEKQVDDLPRVPCGRIRGSETSGSATHSAAKVLAAYLPAISSNVLGPS
jgi:hypothetical protein